MRKSNTAVVTIGIDPGKNTLHLVGLDARRGIVLREKVARARIVSRLANVLPCLIGIEAGMGTHYVTRELLALGHDVRQVPPVYAKPFRQTHKNDFEMRMRLLKPCNVTRRGAYRRKRTNSSISRRCIVCATAW
jgi:transposase